MIEYFSPKGQLWGPIMPKCILQQKNLSLGAKAIYAVLASLPAQGVDHCWPSQAYLAESLGVSERSVRNYLRELERVGLIEVRKSRTSLVNHYFFLMKAEVIVLRSDGDAQQVDGSEAESSFWRETAPSGAAQEAAETTATSANPSAVINLNKELNTNSPLPPHGVSSGACAPPRRADEGEGGSFSPAQKAEPKAVKTAPESCDSAFARLWAAWPVKQAYRGAEDAWKRLWFTGRLPALEALFGKVEELRTRDRWWNNGKAPLLANWLRGERWHDEPVPMTEQKTGPQGGVTPEEKPAQATSQEAAQREMEDWTRQARERQRRELEEDRRRRQEAQECLQKRVDDERARKTLGKTDEWLQKRADDSQAHRTFNKVENHEQVTGIPRIQGNSVSDGAAYEKAAAAHNHRNPAPVGLAVGDLLAHYAGNGKNLLLHELQHKPRTGSGPCNKHGGTVQHGQTVQRACAANRAANPHGATKHPAIRQHGPEHLATAAATGFRPEGQLHAPGAVDQQPAHPAGRRDRPGRAVHADIPGTGHAEGPGRRVVARGRA
jgi:hypothetical protein